MLTLTYGLTGRKQGNENGRQGRARHGEQRLGKARRGAAGEDWQGKVRRGMARIGRARHGKAGSMKYRNKITEVNGIKFHSKKESRRYAELQMLEKAGYIQELQLQPKFLILQGFRELRPRYYIADFQYRQDGKTIVEDVKSEPTRKNPLYRFKRQAFLILYHQWYEFIET